jgi:acyl CoA:acetate/3-ketoacid CoA transferase beta subunit
MPELNYSSAELMIINAARLLRDGDVVFVGVGQPNLACNLAKRTHAPNLVMIYEAGVIGAEPARLPLSIGDPTLVSGALSVVSMYDIFSNYLQRGNVDVGFMGGAQIDKYGNINATVIGGYDHPKVRLPGSGGSQEIAAWANRCYIMTPHQKRRFPEKVEFMTSAGFIDGKGARESRGLRRNDSHCAAHRQVGGRGEGKYRLGVEDRCIHQNHRAGHKEGVEDSTQRAGPDRYLYKISRVNRFFVWRRSRYETGQFQIMDRHFHRHRYGTWRNGGMPCLVSAFQCKRCGFLGVGCLHPRTKGRDHQLRQCV